MSYVYIIKNFFPVKQNTISIIIILYYYIDGTISRRDVHHPLVATRVWYMMHIMIVILHLKDTETITH